jgi:hypothetical protein
MYFSAIRLPRVIARVARAHAPRWTLARLDLGDVVARASAASDSRARRDSVCRRAATRLRGATRRVSARRATRALRRARALHGDRVVFNANRAAAT